MHLSAYVILLRLNKYYVLCKFNSQESIRFFFSGQHTLLLEQLPMQNYYIFTRKQGMRAYSDIEHKTNECNDYINTM